MDHEVEEGGGGGGKESRRVKKERTQEVQTEELAR